MLYQRLLFYLQSVEQEAREITTEVLGCDVQEVQTELITMNEIYTISNEILQSVIPLEDLPGLLPSNLTFKIRDTKIVEMKAIPPKAD